MLLILKSKSPSLSLSNCPFTRAFVNVPVRFGTARFGFEVSSERGPNRIESSRTVLAWPTSACRASTALLGSARFGSVVQCER